MENSVVKSVVQYSNLAGQLNTNISLFRSNVVDLHTEFLFFKSGSEYLRHYNSVHSDSKDFARRSVDSNGSVHHNATMNLHSEHVTEMLRRENSSLIKKVKKYKKSKSKMDKKLQERVMKLLEGQLNTNNSLFLYKCRRFAY